MAESNALFLLRKRNVSGGNLPSTALMGEPFINTYDGTLLFSGTSGGIFEVGEHSGAFEVGSRLYNQKIINRLNVNDFFIVSGNTGIISTYQGSSSLEGKFLSGSPTGLVLANIDDISSRPSGLNGQIQYNNGGSFGASSNLIFDDLTNTLSSPIVSAITFYSGSTELSVVMNNLLNNIEVTHVQPGSNILTGGTTTNPSISVVPSPTFLGIVTATGLTDTSLTSGRVVIAGLNGKLSDNTLLSFDVATNTLNSQNITAQGDIVIQGSLLVHGQTLSAFTNDLYIEDNNIILNYSPTGDTSLFSLGAGMTIQDGLGISATTAFLDVRGVATGSVNRSWATNLEDIRIRETGTVSSPNGKRVIAEGDTLDGGSF